MNINHLRFHHFPLLNTIMISITDEFSGKVTKIKPQIQGPGQKFQPTGATIHNFEILRVPDNSFDRNLSKFTGCHKIRPQNYTGAKHPWHPF